MLVTRPPRAPRDEYHAAVWRYGQLAERDRLARERRRLLAMGPGWHIQPRPRPRWLGPAIDYVAVPLLWAATVVVVIAEPWILALVALQLVTVYGLLRWDARR